MGAVASSYHKCLKIQCGSIRGGFGSPARIAAPLGVTASHSGAADHRSSAWGSRHLTSAALLVYDRYAFPIVDLRVDVHQTPVIELRKVWEFYRPLTDFYIQRNLDPTGLGRWWQMRMELCPDWKPVHFGGRVPQQ